MAMKSVLGTFSRNPFIAGISGRPDGITVLKPGYRGKRLHSKRGSEQQKKYCE
jgi:hypothetical protein